MKNISTWNTAAIIFQLWRIINREDSIWIEWLYKHEFKKKGFWTMGIPYKCSWSFRRILNCRDLANQFIKYTPGRNSFFLLWHDPWSRNSPLSKRCDDALLSALELDSMAPLSSIQNQDQWDLGVSNFSLVRNLRQECADIPIRRQDSITWNNGSVWPVKIATIYEDLSPHRPHPPWFSFVWHNFNPPRYAFYTWLILKERLLTKDRMILFHMHTDVNCVLCQNMDESHEHLFCNCFFSRTILNHCPVMVSSNWSDFYSGTCIVNQLDPIKMKIAHMFISAAFYHIWEERNFRIHN